MGSGTGKELWERIQASQVPRGSARVWFMGQHGFVIKLANKLICIDLYLSENESRLVPPPVAPAEVRGADMIIGTHDHIDHIDRPIWPALAAASPGATFIVPELVREGVCRDLGLDGTRVVGLDDHRHVTLGPIKLSAIPSAHEFLNRDPETGLHPFLGIVIEADGVAIYHAGDTCLYEGLHANLRRWQHLDAMLIPINGRDAWRYKKNVLGNMTFQEAADLAGTIKPGVAVPTHFDMFAFNPGDPQAFADYVEAKYPGLPVQIPRVGESFDVIARR